MLDNHDLLLPVRINERILANADVLEVHLVLFRVVSFSPCFLQCARGREFWRLRGDHQMKAYEHTVKNMMASRHPSARAYRRPGVVLVISHQLLPTGLKACIATAATAVMNGTTQMQEHISVFARGADSSARRTRRVAANTMPSTMAKMVKSTACSVIWA